MWVFGVKDVYLYFVGNIVFLKLLVVLVVGICDISEEGIKRVRWFLCEFSEVGVIVMSGLVKGVDYCVYIVVIESGGYIVVVIGILFEWVYLVENVEF